MVLQLDWLLPRVHTLPRHALLLHQGHVTGRRVARARLLGIIIIFIAAYLMIMIMIMIMILIMMMMTWIVLSK